MGDQDKLTTGATDQENILATVSAPLEVEETLDQSSKEGESKGLILDGPGIVEVRTESSPEKTSHESSLVWSQTEVSKKSLEPAERSTREEVEEPSRQSIEALKECSESNLEESSIEPSVESHSPKSGELAVLAKFRNPEKLMRDLSPEKVSKESVVSNLEKDFEPIVSSLEINSRRSSAISPRNNSNEFTRVPIPEENSGAIVSSPDQKAEVNIAPSPVKNSEELVKVSCVKSLLVDPDDTSENLVLQKLKNNKYAELKSSDFTNVSLSVSSEEAPCPKTMTMKELGTKSGLGVQKDCAESVKLNSEKDCEKAMALSFENSVNGAENLRALTESMKTPRLCSEEKHQEPAELNFKLTPNDAVKPDCVEKKNTAEVTLEGEILETVREEPLKGFIKVAEPVELVEEKETIGSFCETETNNSVNLGLKENTAEGVSEIFEINFEKARQLLVMDNVFPTSGLDENSKGSVEVSLEGNFEEAKRKVSNEKFKEAIGTIFEVNSNIVELSREGNTEEDLGLNSGLGESSYMSKFNESTEKDKPRNFSEVGSEKAGRTELEDKSKQLEGQDFDGISKEVIESSLQEKSNGVPTLAHEESSITNDEMSQGRNISKTSWQNPISSSDVTCDDAIGSQVPSQEACEAPISQEEDSTNLSGSMDKDGIPHSKKRLRALSSKTGKYAEDDSSSEECSKDCLTKIKQKRGKSTSSPKITSRISISTECTEEAHTSTSSEAIANDIGNVKMVPIRVPSRKESDKGEVSFFCPDGWFFYASKRLQGHFAKSGAPHYDLYYVTPPPRVKLRSRQELKNYMSIHGLDYDPCNFFIRGDIEPLLEKGVLKMHDRYVVQASTNEETFHEIIKGKHILKKETGLDCANKQTSAPTDSKKLYSVVNRMRRGSSLNSRTPRTPKTERFSPVAKSQMSSEHLNDKSAEKGGANTSGKRSTFNSRGLSVPKTEKFSLVAKSKNMSLEQVDDKSYKNDLGNIPDKQSKRKLSEEDSSSPKKIARGRPPKRKVSIPPAKPISEPEVEEAASGPPFKTKRLGRPRKSAPMPEVSHVLQVNASLEGQLKLRTKSLQKSPYFSSINKDDGKLQNFKSLRREKNDPPPRSPYNLIQEDLFHDPWQLLISTIFLNSTSGRLAIPLTLEFLKRWPTPELARQAKVDDILDLIEPLGFGRTRAAIILRFSHEYLTKDWKLPSELYGIGEYGNDSYKIFCLKNAWKTVESDDPMLMMYLNWRRATEHLRRKFFVNSNDSLSVVPSNPSSSKVATSLKQANVSKQHQETISSPKKKLRTRSRTK